MEKKKKRASFSQTMPTSIKSVAPAPAEKSEPRVVNQVVEVVVEEPKKGITTMTEVDVVVPENVIVRRVIEDENKRFSSPEIVEESVSATPVSAVSPVAKKTIEKPVEEEVPQKEPEVSPKPRITFGQELRTDEDTHQKETVEELFGKNSQTVMPEITVHKSAGTKGIVLWGITMVAVAIGVGGGLLLFTGRNKVQQPIPTTQATPTTMPQPTAIPTPTPGIIKGNLKVQVLNGGGVVGAGSKMKALLISKGYTVTNVSNADSYNFSDTEINVKSADASILSTLKDDISDTYSVGTLTSTLPDSSLYDVVITVGKK